MSGSMFVLYCSNIVLTYFVVPCTRFHSLICIFFSSPPPFRGWLRSGRMCCVKLQSAFWWVLLGWKRESSGIGTTWRRLNFGWNLSKENVAADIWIGEHVIERIRRNAIRQGHRTASTVLRSVIQHTLGSEESMKEVSPETRAELEPRFLCTSWVLSSPPVCFISERV